MVSNINIVSFLRCVVVLGLVMIINGQTVYAQEGALLRVVTLAGDDGNPMGGANVLLYEQGEDEPGYNCVTNRDGFCEIRNIDSKPKYELRISFIGYQTYRENIIFKAGDRRVERVTLAPVVAEFEEVSVEKRRYITTGEVGVRRISTADISRVPSPVAGGDLASYLQTVPGVITSGDRGGDLFIRGGTPYQNLVLVDNLPIMKPFHISNLFSAFPDNVVQNADMYAGGFGSKYSGVTSAVIDVGLRPGNMRRHRASAALSPYLTSLHAEGPLMTDHQSYLLMGRISTIERFAPDLTGRELPIRFGDVVSRYTFQAYNVICNITGVFTSDSGEIVPGRDVSHTWKNTVVGGRCLGFSETFNHPIDVSAGYTGYTNREGTKQRTERLSSVNQLYMNIDLQQEIFKTPVDYGFGVNFRFYDIELSERFTSLNSLQRSIPLMKFYISSEVKLHSTVTIEPGFASQLTLDTPVTFEPRLRISWQPDGTDRHQLSVAAGKYIQNFSGVSDERDTGTVFTVLQPIQSGDPQPSSLHGIVAYQQRWGSSITTNLEGYAKNHRNIPVSKWTPEPQIEIETALADGFTYGIDFRFEYDSYPLFASLGYGLSKVEYEAVSGDLGAWIEEPIFRYSPAHDQRHKLNALLSYDFEGFNLNTSWEFGTGMPYTQIFGFDFSVRVPVENPQTDPGTARILFSEPYSKRLPYYHRLDISLEKNFRVFSGSQLETQLGVINGYDRNNIFNFDLATLQRVDQSPLLPYVSLKLDI